MRNGFYERYPRTKISTREIGNIKTQQKNVRTPFRHSHAFYLFEDLRFNELLELAINDSLEKDYLERIKVKDFKTSILKDINGFKVK